jgi:hypothetical protein
MIKSAPDVLGMLANFFIFTTCLSMVGGALGAKLVGHATGQFVVFPSGAQEEDVKCPNCGSINVHAEKRGWNVLTGFIRSGRIVITCLKCGHKFRPGQGS